MGTTTFTQEQLGEAPSGGAGTFQFGASSINTSTEVRFLQSSISGSGPATAGSNVIAYAQAVGTLQNLIITHALSGDGGDITYTVIKNGVATDLAVTIDANNTSGNSQAGTESISFGDTLSVRVTKAGALAASPTDIVADIGLV